MGIKLFIARIRDHEFYLTDEEAAELYKSLKGFLDWSEDSESKARAKLLKEQSEANARFPKQLEMFKPEDER